MSMTSDFMARPLEFAKTHAIAPPHGVEMEIQIPNVSGEGTSTIKTDYKGDEAKKLSVGDHATTLDTVGYSRVMRSKKVAYIEMFTDMRDGGASNREGKQVVRMRSQFSAFGEAEPVYFLPWDDRGYIVKLRIPKLTRDNPGPSIFFTAAINGCSVFVQGDPDSPTVYHAGGSTGIKDPSEAARMWRQVLAKHIRDSATASARGSLGGEVNKTHYITSTATASGKSTTTAEQYERELHRLLDKKGSFRVEYVSPWGCVFGVRTGNDWAFYLQENATVTCNYVKKKEVRTVMYARPIQLSKVYPGGSSRIGSMTHQVPVKIDWS